MSSEPDPRPPSAEPPAAAPGPDAGSPDIGSPSVVPQDIGSPDAGHGAGSPTATGPASRAAGRGPVPGPRALRKPARTETRMKDMLGALLILLPIALLIVGVGRTCSFAPTGPALDPGAGPTVDAPARLAEYARGSAFGLRVPAVPWRSNSTDRGQIDGGGTAVRVGYLTEQGRYLRLVQSDATEEALVRTEAGGGVPIARGVTPAAGLNWVTYEATNGEPIRVTTLPGTPAIRLLITGSGTDDEFRTLATATAGARPLPPGNATN